MQEPFCTILYLYVLYSSLSILIKECYSYWFRKIMHKTILILFDRFLKNGIDANQQLYSFIVRTVILTIDWLGILNKTAFLFSYYFVNADNNLSKLLVVTSKSPANSMAIGVASNKLVIVHLFYIYLINTTLFCVSANLISYKYNNSTINITLRFVHANKQRVKYLYNH